MGRFANEISRNIKMNQNIQIKEAIKQQFKKCVASPIYFLKKYAKVQHPVRGLVPFDLYKFQENTIQQFVDHEWNIILKSRQMGISTLCAGYILWMLNFNSNKTVLIIANTQEVAMNLIKKIKTMYDGLPNWLKEQLITNNKQSLEFKNMEKRKKVLLKRFLLKNYLSNLNQRIMAILLKK